ESYAGIIGGAGTSTISAGNAITLVPGLGGDADAVIGTPTGGMIINAISCTGCTALSAADPILNGTTDSGLFGNPVTLILPEPKTPLVEVDNSIIYATTLAEGGGESNTEYSEEDEEEAKEEGQSDKAEDNATDKKAAPPVCI
ncbi:MAG: hypothetical protein ACKVP2_03140, partial [Burkholderiales bacterium]